MTATGRLEKTALVVNVWANHRCQVDTLPVYEVHRWRENVLEDGTSPGTQLKLDFGVAAVLALSTWGLVADGKAGCKYKDEMTGMEKRFPAFCYGFAAVTGIGATTMFGRGVYHLFGMGSTDEGTKLVAGPPNRSRIEACEPERLGGKSVVVQLGAERATGVTTSDGEIRVSLLGVGQATLGQPAVLGVGDAWFPIQLSARFAEDAREALAAHPGSRVARERLDAAVQQVAEQIASRNVEAVARILDEVSGVRASLKEATSVRARFREIAIEDAIAILTNKGASGTLRELCVTRALVISVYGLDAWRGVFDEIRASAMDLFGLGDRSVQQRLLVGC